MHRLSAAFALAVIACGNDERGSPGGPYPDDPPLVRKDIQARLCPEAARLLDVERACDGMEDGVNRLRVERCDGAGLDISRRDATAGYRASPNYYVIFFQFHDGLDFGSSLEISTPPGAVQRAGGVVTLGPRWTGGRVYGAALPGLPLLTAEELEVTLLTQQCEDEVRVYRYVALTSPSSPIHRAKLGFTKRCPTARTEIALPAEVTYRGCVVVETPYPELPGAVAVPAAPEADPPAP